MTYNFKKINLTKLLNIYEFTSNLSKNCENPFLLYERIIASKFYISVIFNKLLFIHLSNDKLFIFNKILNLIATIDLKHLKNAVINGKYSLILKFFPEYSINFLNIKFLSNVDRASFIDDILNYLKRDDLTIFKKRLMLEMLKDDQTLINKIMCLGIKYVSNHNLIYQQEIHNINHKCQNSYNFIRKNNVKCLPIILFLLSQINLIQKCNKILFLPMNNVKYDSTHLDEIYFEMVRVTRTHKDSIYHAKKERRRVQVKREKIENEKKLKELELKEKQKVMEESKSTITQKSSGRLKMIKEETEDGIKIDMNDDADYDDDFIHLRPRHNKNLGIQIYNVYRTGQKIKYKLR
jgi:hypothetical protein